ncbi:MAG TPA: hypothetical protein VMI31_08910 [Fimbriimonadaceae bacterium]|nr:hypothetical protein [Fimbriimonadaceae bacterium]
MLIVAVFAILRPTFGQDFASPSFQISFDPSNSRLRHLYATRADPREILNALLKLSGRRGVVAESVHGAVTLSISDEALDAAFGEVARAGHAGVVFADGRYVFTDDGTRGPFHGFHARQEDVRVTIQRLMKLAGKPYIMYPEVQGAVSIDGGSLGLDALLGAILGQVDATCRYAYGYYQIVPSPDSPAMTPAPWRPGLPGQPCFGEVMRYVCARLGLSLDIDPDLSRDRTFRGTNLDSGRALDDLTASNDCRYWIHRGVCRVYRPTPLDDSPAMLAPPYGTECSVEDLPGPVVPSLDLDCVDCRDALGNLMRLAKLPYSLGPGVQGTVTVNLRNVRFSTALTNVLKQVDSIVCREGDTYVFLRKNRRTDPPILQPLSSRGR